MLQVLSGKTLARPPVWMMRQAGRYLPEYRELRARAGGFLDLCFTPTLAAEVTLQPIHRFGFDAAILFSDILVVPHALGRRVTFEAGEGPRLDPLDDAVKIAGLRREIDMAAVEPVFETIRLVRRDLAREVTFLGFCGAPWTVATYMVAGRGTPDQAPARLLAYREPEAFASLIDTLVDASARYLVGQLAAGVDAVQIFDTWAGVLSPREFRRWSVAPTAEIVRRVRRAVPDAKIIGFPRDAGTNLDVYARETGVNGVGLDWMIDAQAANRAVPAPQAVQGNLDPLALIAGGRALDQAVDDVLAAFEGRPHIFNLGHGITPETPIAHVERMIRRVRGS